MCRTDVRKPGNMPIYCVGTKPAQESPKKTKFQRRQTSKTACHATAAVVWAVIWSVGEANGIQSEAPEEKTACHTSARARMHGRMTPWRKQ